MIDFDFSESDVEAAPRYGVGGGIKLQDEFGSNIDEADVVEGPRECMFVHEIPTPEAIPTPDKAAMSSSPDHGNAFEACLPPAAACESPVRAPACVAESRPRRNRLPGPASPIDDVLPALACDHGHELAQVKVTADIKAQFGVTACDKCGRTICVGAWSQHCAVCVFDICSSCVRSKRASFD